MKRDIGGISRVIGIGFKSQGSYNGKGKNIYGRDSKFIDNGFIGRKQIKSYMRKLILLMIMR